MDDEWYFKRTIRERICVQDVTLIYSRAVYKYDECLPTFDENSSQSVSQNGRMKRFRERGGGGESCIFKKYFFHVRTDNHARARSSSYTR